jgi:organic radical activating enzyme
MNNSILPVQEIISETIQGEGYWTGQLSSFVRLHGCPVGCSFCDTGYAKQSTKDVDFIKLSIPEVIKSVKCKNVVITGGEPTLQKEKLSELINALHQNNRYVCVETSGIFYLESQVFDWITLSPKEHLNPSYPVNPIYWKVANELKIVIQKESDIEFYLEKIIYFIKQNKPVFLQPEWSNSENSLKIIMNFLRIYSAVKLSIQSHKYLGLR